RRVEQVRVERLLVVPVLRPRAVCLVLRELQRVVGAGFARREDVAKAPAVVLAVTLSCRGRRRERQGQQRDDSRAHGAKSGPSTDTWPQDVSTTWARGWPPDSQSQRWLRAAVGRDPPARSRPTT